MRSARRLPVETKKRRKGAKRVKEVTRVAYDVEKALLTKALSRNEFSTVYKKKIRPNFIADDETRDAFKWVNKIYEKTGEAPSLGALLDEFPDFEPVSVSDGVEFLIEKVKDRKIYSDIHGFLKKTTEETRDSSRDGLKYVTTEALKLAATHSEEVEEDLTDGAAELSKKYDDLKNAKGVLGWSYPWRSITKVTRGLRTGQYVAFYGPTGTFKTWLLLYMANWWWETYGVSVLFVTHEMPIEDIRFRWAAIRAKVDYERFQDGKLDAEEEVRFYDVLDEMAEDRSPFHVMEIEETGMIVCATIRAKAREVKAKIILIDGLGGLPDNTEWGSFSDINRALKTMARVDKMCVVATHHVNRDTKKVKVESMDSSDVALGQTLERYVDNLFRIDRLPIHEEEDELDIYMKKGREVKRKTLRKVTINALPAYNFSEKFVHKDKEAAATDTDMV